ncbi:hypothetical protein P8A22_17020 [Streptomyces laculatispora]|uniref:Uncharacterized protein n=1 Tax=Streptomyces laculatispora TaxID=887464 RepID=A0ABY9I5E0_9ACTN|nr:hypothetical protein [Streptomyces laculatispora]WLQ41534.1 hypothetical protein P8A22_17020 [Streptomyces laculatispora]
MGFDAPERTAVRPDSAGLTGVRLHTRMPVTPAWIARHVVPAARSLGEQGAPGVQLRRGWLHGPHFDVLAMDAPGAPGGAVDWQSVAARLDAGPLDAARALTDEVYLDQAREFGRLEAVQPPYLPLRAHGAVEVIAPDDPALRSREPRLDALRHVVGGALARPVLRMIESMAAEPRSGTRRLAEAFAALVDTHFLGPAYGVFSPRSHVEAFLAWAAPAKDMRPVFKERLAKDAAMLRTVVEERLSGEASPAAAEWRTAFAYSSGALESAVAAGTLTLDLLDSVTDGVDRSEMGPPGATTVVPRGEQPDTEFHRTVHGSGAISSPSPFFAAYRLLTNLFYQQLPLLTVSPMQRYYMCFALAETVDEVLGVSWQDRLDAVTGPAVATPEPTGAPR